MKTGKSKTMVEKGEYEHCAPGGRIVYSQNGVLLAVPYDERKMEVTGRAEPVLDGVQYRPSSYAQLAIAANGILAYILGDAKDLNNTLVTIDHAGVSHKLVNQVGPDDFLEFRACAKHRVALHSIFWAERPMALSYLATRSMSPFRFGNHQPTAVMIARIASSAVVNEAQSFCVGQIKGVAN